MDDIIARVLRVGGHLPGLERGTSYGTPAAKVRGKGIARVKDDETLVLMIGLADKELLMEAAPEIYFETDHYRGWPAVLVRMAAIDDDELAHRLEQAWRMKAPRLLVKALDAGR